MATLNVIVGSKVGWPTLLTGAVVVVALVGWSAEASGWYGRGHLV